MSGTNPVGGGGPELTPAGHTARLGMSAVAVVAAIGIAFALVYYAKPRETAETYKERTAERRQETEQPGNPGRKPGFLEVPAAQIREAVAEKPTDTSKPLHRTRPRPVPSEVSTWTAPKPQAVPTSAAVQPAAAKEEGDGHPTKLAGIPVMRAERIDDISWYLMPGEKIMCQNNEPLTEKTGAFWTANIPNEKLSRDGSRVLVPAGSQAFGKIATGFNNGDRRLAGVITHITGPSVPGKPTLFIPIDMGQVGDDLGRVDMDGNIESNFWPRLATVGAYAALDMIARGGTSYATGTLNRALNGNSDGVNVNVGNFGGMGTGQSLAGTAMQEELRKQPGFSRPQAQPCTIMITKPVDFRKALYIGG